MEIRESIRLSFEGNCVLFTGAGASVSAKNIKDDYIKASGKLTELLYDRCDLENDGNLSYAVDSYLETHGEFSIINLLKEEYTVRSVATEHSILASIPWKRIYTTNYDNVLEFSYNQNGKLLSPVSLNDRHYFYKDKSHLCIHLNGHIGDLNPEALNNNFKLSDVSYLTNDFKNSEWITLFRNDLRTSDAIFFVGFSLNYDLDLKRIVFNSPDIQDKCFFIVHENEKQVTLKNIEKFGKVYPIGLIGFTDQIVQLKRSYIPRTTTKIKFNSFLETKFSNIAPEQKDVDNYKLFVNGNINTQLLQYSIFDSNEFQYIVDRDKTKIAVEAIKNGCRDLLILSDLGNGKTIFVQSMKFHLKSEGYEVFEFSKYYDSLDNEVEQICTNTDKAVIILENFSQHFDLLEKFRLLRSDLILICTERSLVYDILSSRYEENIGLDYLIVDLNLLSDAEIEKFVILFDKYGYWGRYAAYNNVRKSNFIREKCKKSTKLLLLKLLDSNNILERLTKLISDIKTRKNNFEAVVLILVSKVFGFELDLDDLIYTLDDELLNKPSFIKDPGIREFVDFSQMKIVVKSSILAESILLNILDPKDVVNTLIKVCKRLDNKRHDRNVKIILRSIISFSKLQSILQKDSNEYKYYILHFFEAIRHLSYCYRNPLYWLQYAIARLSERDYPMADKYFETAYSYARGMDNFDTFQIDNHFARHIIENEIYNGSNDTCMSQFLKAHRIVVNPIDNNKYRHYPFRVASHYFAFYEKYYLNLEEQDKIIFIHSCNEVLRKIDVYMNSVSGYRIKNEVARVKESLEFVVKKSRT